MEATMSIVYSTVDDHDDDYDKGLMMMKEFGMIRIGGGNNDNSAQRMKGFEGRGKVKREERHYEFQLEKSIKKKLTMFVNDVE